MGSKELPKRADLVDYNYAVAGHAGTLCDPDGELFIKPCTAQEIGFYESAKAEHPDFAELMPVYMGTLQLNDATDINSINEQIPGVADHISQHMKEEVVKMAHEIQPQPQSTVDLHADWAPSVTKKIVTNTAIVLENAAHGYKHPNILDVKLGTRLWADDAPLKKRARFDKIASETTHGDLGFRIAGMRVYKGTTDKSELDEEDYLIYDKEFGKTQVKTHNVASAFKKFIFNESAKVDEELGKAVARAFLDDLRRVEQVLAAEESRMYSASLLFVFEGDGEALRACVEETSASTTLSDKGNLDSGSADGRSTARVDSGIAVDEDGEMIAAAAEDESDMEDDLPRAYSLKLIDFAHAEWTPGQGPDENSLKGVRSLIRIFEELAD
jgi:1D-myo-inositol-tetrakisphosphate 5-kinase/inositol-polyphosphate multikinase